MTPTTQFFTYQHEVPLRAGQTVHYTPGHGFYAGSASPMAQSPSPSSRGGFLSPAQLAALAAQQANSELAVERAPILSVMQEAARQALGAESAKIGFTNAAVDALKGIGPQLDQGYSQALSSLSDLPGGAAAYGDIFKTAIGKEQGAADTWAGQLGSIEGTMGQNDLAGLIAHAQDAQQQYQQQLIDLAAKYPSLRDQAAAEIQKSQLDLANYTLRAQAQADVEQKLGLQTKDTQSQIDYRNAQIQKAKDAGSNPDPALSKIYGHVVDHAGNPIYDANGNVIPIAQSAKAGGGNKQSAVQRANSVGVSIARANSSKVAGLDNPATPQDESKTSRQYKVGYYRTLAEIEASITPVLEPYGFATSDIIRMATRLANAYYPPGEGGRPKLTAAKRATRTRKATGPASGVPLTPGP
jgi:hypothetical protein